ncbi:beta strand repeat-containing protein, partial [Flavobacterium sp. W21_SRS_FM6]|uniref:beta strand repeat-containing protein n=1 Tax=Flavobacterium sp. W21_SRS_FM6 TaxID=3240268 RepID=UPI003F92E698
TDTTLAAPSLALATDTGSSNSDGITTDATVNVTLAADVASWQYSLNGGSTWTTGSGTSFELAADTAYAIADIQVKQTDVAGNASSATSNAAAITTDTTLAAPSLALATDTGSSNSDGITTDATVNVTLAADVASWQYSLNGGSTWTAGSGTSFELAANTAYTIGDIQVKQTDTAGNTSSAASNSAAITTDTTLAAPSLALATDTGSSNSDGITTDATVNVTLAADVASWQYSLNGGSTWTTGSGTSFELAADTAYAIADIQVKQTDVAGNASSATSNAAAITTDTTPLAAPSLALATDTGSSNSDGITTDATVNVSLAADVASWQYSLNSGSTWTTGTGTSFELSTNTAYSIGDVQVTQTDTAGNTSAAASNAATITTDTTAPTAAATAVTISSAENASVQSSEIGTAYLVSSNVSVTSLSDITSSADNQWNSVAITAANTATNLDATGLVDGSYKVYTTDTAGNLSSASAQTVTVDNFAGDTSTVVFDAISGHSSAHSSRTFDANTTYTIYLRVDSNSASISLNSAEKWQSANNLGQDDVIVLVGNGSPVIGYFNNNINTFYTSSSFSNYSVWSSGFWAASILGSGVLVRAYNNSRQFADLWNGSYAVNPNANNTFNQVYLTDMPTGVLTSQGLNPV